MPVPRCFDRRIEIKISMKPRLGQTGCQVASRISYPCNERDGIPLDIDPIKFRLDPTQINLRSNYARLISEENLSETSSDAQHII